MVALNFNASQVKPNAALEAIPSGMYPVIITKSEEKPTKAGTGFYIELEMTIQGGEYGGRKVFDRLNIKNANQTAVDIAYATLSAICHVTGRLNIQDTAQLHGVPFMAVVSKRVRDDLPPPAPGEQPQYTNEVKGYKDLNGNDPGFSGQAPAQTQQAPGWAQQAPPPAQQQQQPWTPPPAQQAAPAQQQPAWAPPAQQAAPAATTPAGNQAPPPWAQQAPAA